MLEDDDLVGAYGHHWLIGTASEPVSSPGRQCLRAPARAGALAARRTSEGLSKREMIRCLKRYVAREVYEVLVA